VLNQSPATTYEFPQFSPEVMKSNLKERIAINLVFYAFNSNPPILNVHDNVPVLVRPEQIFVFPFAARVSSP
jgi:hypothetical protein